jgi:hypothetical protein
VLAAAPMKVLALLKKLRSAEAPRTAGTSHSERHHLGEGGEEQTPRRQYLARKVCGTAGAQPPLRLGQTNELNRDRSRDQLFAKSALAVSSDCAP